MRFVHPPGRRMALAAGGLALLAGFALASVLVPPFHDALYGAGQPRRAAASAERRAGIAKPLGPTVLVRPHEVGAISPSRFKRQRGVPPAVASGASAENKPEYVPGQLLVKFDDGTPAEVVKSVLERAAGHVDENVKKIDVRVVDVPKAQTGDALATLRASPAVDDVERDTVVEKLDTVPNDSLWSSEWGAQLVKAPAAWDTTHGSPDVVIAVLDTGVDYRHPDLQEAFVLGYDLVNSDSDPTDDDGHGTAAAGVIGARADNGEGVAGICWTCSLMPVKVLDASGSGTTSTVAAGIVWAADHGARVISMSLGGAGGTQTLADAVQYAASKGVILVAAAGNSGSTDPVYPAAYPQVISVAGTTASDALYSWSNRGPWVQVAAPGCNTAPWLGGTYVNFCGTSSATPVVAGLAGLALAAPTAAAKGDVEIAGAIRASALPLPGGVLQYGRADAQALLTALGAARPLAPPPPPPPPPAPAPVPPAAGPPSAAPAPARVSQETIRGTVTRSAPLRRYLRSLQAGRLTAKLTFARGRTLRLFLLNRSGTVVARVSGRSPLTLGQDLRAGIYEFYVGARTRRTAFTLALTSRHA
jgi:subtilisin family serine protease